MQNNDLAKESDLFIFCDGSRNEDDLLKIKKVHKIIDNISGFKNVVVEKRALNLGLAKSVIYGVNKIVNQFGKIIVLEDDIVTTKNFLKFMNESLEFYKNDKRVFSITGFNFPIAPKTENDVFASHRGSSWSWATWKDRWIMVDFDDVNIDKEKTKEFRKLGDNLVEMLRFQREGKIDSWAIRVCFHQFKNNLLTIYPTNTFVKNIGLDGSGVHKDEIEGWMDFDLKDEKFCLGSIDNIFNKKTESGFLKNFHQKEVSKKGKVKIKFLIIGMVLGYIVNSFLS